MSRGDQICNEPSRPAACKGAGRRIRDAKFKRVHDPRQAAKVIHPLHVVLCALVGAMITRARSLRRVEERTGQIVKKHGSFLGIKRRIADNTLGRIVPRLKPAQICAALHRQVKAEYRRGNLKPDRLPIATAAIDGKNIATGALARTLSAPFGSIRTRPPRTRSRSSWQRASPTESFAVPATGCRMGSSGCIT